MKIIWATDIHTDSATEKAFKLFCQTVRESGAEILILCGDIATGPDIAKVLARLRQEVGMPVYFVLGNHDFYHGGIGEVRYQVEGAAATMPGLVYLTRAGVISLTDKVALVGHDGWADARSGNIDTTPVTLNDDNMIRDFAGLPKMLIRGKRAELADESAAYLIETVRAAWQEHEEVIVATHVPPSAGTAWHNGERGGVEWMPHMVNTVLGESLIKLFFEFADKGQAKKLTLLCGHTHGACAVELAPGFIVYGGEAKYGEPKIQFPIEVPGRRRAAAAAARIGR